MQRKITFVHAPIIRYDQNYGTVFSPLWAYTLASHIPESWQACIVDCIVEDVAAIGPSDVFAFSGINQDIDSIRAVHGQLKARYPDAIFILGGPITWSLEQEGKLGLLEFFDHLFILDGEKTLPDFLTRIESDDASRPPKIIRAERFPLAEARCIRFDLYDPNAGNYYGALIEVSRGCPFLCEFCDIRVLPGNNRSHNKDVGLIVEELDAYFRLGVTQFQFACDNFIGDIVWARECVDAILAWKRKVGAKISIFTWLTINLYKMPDLMRKMREAGFSILFIGIESVNRNSLLETAKVQNCSALKPAVLEIQSYGFIIAPGLIFGFDSDTESVFDDTLDFLVETGLIGGDPSFLMALPGTPLYARMKRTNRLVEREESVTTREKITTNMRYLLDADFLARGFVRFMHHYTSPSLQLARFRRHLEIISESEKFVPNDGVGYGSPREYIKLQFRDPVNRKYFLSRIGYLLRRPSNFIAAFKAWRLMKRYSRRFPGLAVNFNYWLYVWTNMGLKYGGLKEGDVVLDSVDEDFDISSLIVDAPAAAAEAKHGEGPKAGHQARYTDRALRVLVDQKAAAKNADMTAR